MAMQSKRMMAVSAHAADFCSRSGGAIAKYVEAGWEVRVLSLSYGEKGESGELFRTIPDIALAEVRQIRDQEARQAAGILGCDIRFMDWGDHPLFINEARFYRLIDEIREWRPQILTTHWTTDPLNWDHQFVAENVIRACSCLQSAGLKLDHGPTTYPDLFFFEPSVGLTEFELWNPDTYLDITPVFEKKVRALECFKAQPQLPENYSQYALRRGRQARSLSRDPSIQYAEAFKRYKPVAVKMFP